MHGTHDTLLILFQDRDLESSSDDIPLEETDCPEIYAGKYGIDVTSRSVSKTIEAQKLLYFHKPKQRCSLSSNIIPSCDLSATSDI